MSIRPLVQPLTQLLPCKWCRDSFNEFYAQLGDPLVNSGAEWLYYAHTLVDTKLANQRILAISKDWPEKIKIELRGALGALVDVPKFEVVQKRFMVNRDEAITRRSLTTSLLSIVFGAVELEKNNAVAAHALRTPLSFFLQGLIDIINDSKQKNSDELYTIVFKTFDAVQNNETWPMLLKRVGRLKYGSGNFEENIELLKAGACLKGTCS